MDNLINKNIDYSLAILIGFFAGIFAIPTLINIGLRSQPVLIALPLLGAFLIFTGIALSRLLAKRFAVFLQIGKFGAVGFLNTALDFGVLNLISLASGITSGLIVGGINIPGFVVAVTNSYFWNKFWVFKNREKESLFHDFPKFLAVSIGGLIINSALVALISTYASPIFGINQGAWLNVAKAVAVAVALAWNFLGYKFLVFTQKPL